jgi:membrane-bound lytic murein transglycosylase A
LRSKSAYLAEQSDPARSHYVFAYTITITNTGAVAAQLVSRHWIITDAEQQVQEVKGWAWSVSSRCLQPGESFEYTSGTSLPTAVGTMRGTYQMVAGDGKDVRRRNSALHAVDAARASLGLRGRPSPVSFVDPRGGLLRLGPIVHVTIATAMTSASSASSRKPAHRPAPPSPFALRVALAAALAAITGCVTTPPAVPPAVTTPPAVTPAAPPSLPAKYVPAAWTALPGWSDDRVDEAWPALRAGCAALVASAATSALWQGPCIAAQTVTPIDRNTVRAFFENHFIPYQVVAADGRDTGMVTGYYEPLLDGSRVRSARYNVPLYAAPDDLLTIDLTELYPELKNMRLRGRVEGKRVVPYWSRADIEHGAAPVVDKTLVYVADPVEAFFLQIQGSGRVRLTEGGSMRVGYADQNGHPYRSIGRVLVDRGELPLERASMQGIREWGRRNPEKLGPLLDENPSYVFFREVPPPTPGTLEAQIDGPFGSLGVPLCASAPSPLIRAPFRSACRSTSRPLTRFRRGR